MLRKLILFNFGVWNDPPTEVTEGNTTVSTSTSRSLSRSERTGNALSFFSHLLFRRKKRKEKWRSTSNRPNNLRGRGQGRFLYLSLSILTLNSSSPPLSAISLILLSRLSSTQTRSRKHTRSLPLLFSFFITKFLCINVLFLWAFFYILSLPSVPLEFLSLS